MFNIGKEKEVFYVTKGSPRDLTAEIDKKDKKIGETNVVLTIRPYPAFSPLSRLVPQHNIVSDKDIIPGINHYLMKGNNFPVPKQL